MKFRLLAALLFPFVLFAQKKPLDHTVYDGWQSIGERALSADGKWMVYSITPQEGDADLFIQSTTDTANKIRVSRGYSAMISEDSRFVIFRIRPWFKDTRDARVKKKRPEDFPKDSVGILELGKNNIVKIAKARSFKIPQKAGGWVAVHKEKDAPPRATGTPTQRTVDSLRKDDRLLSSSGYSNQKSKSRQW